MTPQGEPQRLVDHLRTTIARLLPIAQVPGTYDMLLALRDETATQGTDARWMRHQFHRTRSLPATVRSMTQAFRATRAGAEQPTVAPERRRIRANSEPFFKVQTLASSDTTLLALDTLQ